MKIEHSSDRWPSERQKRVHIGSLAFALPVSPPGETLDLQSVPLDGRSNGDSALAFCKSLREEIMNLIDASQILGNFGEFAGSIGVLATLA